MNDATKKALETLAVELVEDAAYWEAPEAITQYGELEAVMIRSEVLANLWNVQCQLGVQ